jgi:hypothetical protein
MIRPYRDRPSFARAYGMLTVKVLPLPISLVTVMSPPCICASRLLMERPRPVPPYLNAVLPWP